MDCEKGRSGERVWVRSPERHDVHMEEGWSARKSRSAVGSAMVLSFGDLPIEEERRRS